MTSDLPSSTMLVTGASGFLGGHLCQMLVAAGHRVRGLVRGEAELVPGVERIQVSGLEDRTAIAAGLEGVHAVFHLAARAHVMRDAQSDPLFAYRMVNVQGTRTMLDLARAAGVQAFVYASSVKAVGEATREPWRTTTKPAPTDPYGLSKLEAEALVQEVAREHHLHAPMLRLPAIYGPGMRANLLRMFELVNSGIPLPVGGIDNRRSLIYVENAAAALMAAMNSPAAGGKAWFVSDGTDPTTAELVRGIAVALGRPARIVTLPGALLRAAAWFGDLASRVVPFPLTTAALNRIRESLVVDATEFSRATGFQPPYTMQQGLARTAQWFGERKRR